jgi:DNA-binding NarL/FixJ family response regulator
LIRVVIADDHKLVREGFQLLLSRASDIQVVGEARDGQEAVELVGRLAPDVVLMDITMPRMNGIEATKQIREQCCKTQVIIVSMVSDETLLSQAHAYGAKGHISKNDCFDRLISEIRFVASGTD